MGLLVIFSLINRNTIKIVENSTKLETSRTTSQPKNKTKHNDGRMADTIGYAALLQFKIAFDCWDLLIYDRRDL